MHIEMYTVHQLFMWSTHFVHRYMHIWMSVYRILVSPHERLIEGFMSDDSENLDTLKAKLLCHVKLEIRLR